MQKNRKLKKSVFILGLIISGFFALLLGIFAPYCAKVRPELINKGDPLMSKIYNKIKNGNSNEEILSSLSIEEKQLLEDYEIKWFESILKIKTDKGILKAEYLPIKHVIVYGTNLEIQYGEKNPRYLGYFSPWGVKNCELKDELQTLINTTLFGTNEIILGNISEIEQVNYAKRYDETMLYQYMILKNLIEGNPSFFKYIMVLADPERDCHWRYQINEWIDKLLTQSILSPRIPDLNPNYEKDFCDGLRQWYAINNENIKFTNQFLFE